MDENREEIEALLRELECAGGFSYNAAVELRPFSSRRCGSADIDNTVRLYAKNSAKPVGRTLFSSFTRPAVDCDTQCAPIPLDTRLPPMRPVAYDLPVCATTVSTSTSTNTSISPHRSSGLLSQRVSLDEARRTAALLSAGLQAPLEHTVRNEAQQLPEDSSPEKDMYREENFLPIMCARYMNPVGISPRPLWGHTLTAMRGGKLLVFGGMDIDQSAESSKLFEYDAHHIAWDPVYVAAGTPPAPRAYHAACAHEGRWLYISGGMRDGGIRVLGDLHCYDTHTQEWSCLWSFSTTSATNRNEPTPRFGHSMIIYEDRLYLFGGRTARRDESDVQSSLGLANSDVYVFSLSTRKWRKRIRVSAKQTCADTSKTSDASAKKSDSCLTSSLKQQKPHRPSPRFHHAAAVLGHKMFIHGGLDEHATLSDTWALDLKERTWEVLHDGSSADAFPRERHHLFACGEALLVVGGCSPSMHSGRIALKYHNFAAVLPLAGDAVPCWIPVAMGNVAVVSPNKKCFGAAFSGGFVHVFGGVNGAEPATNTMIRFLAADGFVSHETRTSTPGAKDESLRAMMRSIREGVGCVVFDAYAIPRAWDASDAVDLKAIRPFGMHRALVQRRAPKFWNDLIRCRTEPLRALSRTTVADISAELGSSEGIDERKAVPAMHSAVAYYTEGNSRVQGLSVPLTSDQLQDLLDYIYWGGMRYRAVLDDDDDDDDDDDNNNNDNNDDGNNNNEKKNEKKKEKAKKKKKEEEEEDEDTEEEQEEQQKEEADNVKRSRSAVGPSRGNEQQSQAQAMRRNIKALRHAADVYELYPLADLCESLLQRSRHRKQQQKQQKQQQQQEQEEQQQKRRRAQAHSLTQLRGDLSALLDSGAGATMTVLFVDPHTKQRAVHALHPFVLAPSSAFFSDLLRPILSGQRSAFQIGPVVAKTTGGANGNGKKSGGGARTRRGILVGPVSVPSLALQPLLRFLYTQELRVPREAAFAVMLGSHLLDIAPLQAHCESILAREEVNYVTAAEFYTLAGKYEAPLLREVALLTAVMGYAEVRHSAGFKALSEKEAKEIEAVAQELGAGAWIAPPEPVSKVKPTEVYLSRWNASAQ